jgi:hypothetical protein
VLQRARSEPARRRIISLRRAQFRRPGRALPPPPDLPALPDPPAPPRPSRLPRLGRLPVPLPSRIRVPDVQLTRVRLPGPRLPWPRLPRLRLPRPHWRPRLAPRPATMAAAVAWLALGIALFTVYLHVSRTSPVNSDGAANALQGWSLLHGNLLLHGWQLSDVSFYTTELPQYALLEAITGLGPDVVHLAAAMTYTLLVLGAGMLAKGRATGRAGVLRAGIAIGIMLAPQAGTGVYVLMLSPDHTGSTVPVLLAWILLDRAGRRWYVPPLAGLLLAWALVADNIVLITGIGPLAAVGALRAYRIIVRRGAPAAAAWFEISLVAAAVAAVAAAHLAVSLIASHGGYYVYPVHNQLAPFSELPSNLMLTLQGILVLFGADFLSHTVSYATALIAVHLVGVGLVAWAVGIALRWISRAEVAVQLLAASIVASLAAYLLGRNAVDLNSTREFAAVLPCGAALAGRLLARRLAAARLVPALAIVLTAYLLGLGRTAALPPAPAQGSQLASWLSEHHLSYGLSGYWQGNAVTLATGGRIRLRSVAALGPHIDRDAWETQPSWYDPRLHQASFVVLTQDQPGAKSYPWMTSVTAAFGQPVSISYVGQYTIMVWNKNLLAELPR